MTITVYGSDPASLLAKIKAGIDKGHIQTWSYDADGDFTHTPNQWIYKAWFRPLSSDGKLFFRILGPTGIKITKEVYAVYHGRFIEMLLAHFDHDFGDVSTSALLTVLDIYS